MTRIHGSTPASLSFPGQASARRGPLRGAALAGGGILAVSAVGIPTLTRAAVARAQTNDGFFEDDVAVLNFALTLEHLDSTLYREGLDQFAEQDFVDAGYDASVREYLAQIVENEETQVRFLTDTIDSLGGDPVGEDDYTFPYTDVPSWLALSEQVETVGLGAYTGSAQYLIDNDDLLTAALTIHGVEARHLSYFRLLNGGSPFPNATEAPLTPQEVLAAAAPFFTNGLPATPAGA